MAEELIVSRPQEIGAEEAKSRMNRHLAFLVLTAPNLEDCQWAWSLNRPGVWQANVSGKAYGYSASGRLVCTPTSVEVYGDIPWYAFAFRSRIVKEISDGIDRGLKLDFKEYRMAKEKSRKSGDGPPDRVKQFGALVEVAWFLVASVGMHIKGDECDFECCVEGAAKARKQAEEYANAAGNLLDIY